MLDQPTIAVRVTLKYLEKGHTSMNADASHQLVQRKLEKPKMSDFRQAVETGIKVTTVSHEEFFEFQSGVSQKNLRS